MLLKRLRQPGIPGMRLLLLTRLAHRMHDYARILAVVTVLSAVVLTGLNHGLFQLSVSIRAPGPSRLLRKSQQCSALTSDFEGYISTPLNPTHSLAVDGKWPAGLVWQAVEGSGRDRKKLVPTSSRHQWRKRSVSSYFVFHALFERQKQNLSFFIMFKGAISERSSLSPR